MQEPVFVEKEHLQVYLRIRPLTSAESESGESQVCSAEETEELRACLYCGLFRWINSSVVKIIDVFPLFCHFTGLYFIRAPGHCDFKAPQIITDR